MEQQLLEAVLGGQLELSAALAWALGDDSQPPPIELRLGSPWKSPSAPRPVLRPASFRVHVLNHVREQAELVLAAAEQEAAGGGSSEAGSHPPTPQPQPAAAEAGPAAAEAARAPAAPRPRPQAAQGRPQPLAAGSSAGSASGQPWPQPGPSTHQIRQPQRQPGLLDDANFPTLAAAAASGGGSGSAKKHGGSAAGRASPANLLAAAPGQQRQQQGGKRRTIVPAKVASMDVNPLFQLAAGQPAGHQQGDPPQAVQPTLSPQPPAPAQQQQQQQQHAAMPAAAAAAATLPMSPPPIAVRVPAPGAAAVAASLLMRGGGRGAAAASSPSAAAGSPGREGSTPKRITPIRLAQPAEVQQTFITAASGASPHAARRDMLQQSEMQQRSRPGSRLGTPMAGGLLECAPGAFGRPASAASSAASALGTRSSDGSGGEAGSSSRSPLLWSADEQSVCQQLSFDVLSPAKPAGTEAAAAAAGKDGSKAGEGEGSVTRVAVAAHAGPSLAAGAPAGGEQLAAALGCQLESLHLGASSSSSSREGIAAAGRSDDPSLSRQQRILDSAYRMGARLAPAGGTTSGGFDAPASFPPSLTRPLQLRDSGMQLQPSDSASQGAADSGQEEAQRGGVQQLGLEQGQEEADVALCPQGRLLAELHAALLRCCSSISLSAELDLLLNLLAVPSAVRIDPALTPVTVLWCGGLAQRYACCVLQSAGGLIRGLGPQLLADLAALPLVRSSFPRLHAAMQAALQHFASTQLHTEKAYHQVRAGGGILSLHGLSAFTSDGRRTRTQEEQRRISNRESCRDEWFNLMKEAAAQTHSFAARQLGRLSAGTSDRQSDSGRTATTASGGDEAGLLQLMQQSAGDLLRRLRPDNFGAFAELFSAAVLQAAATGETLLDEELSSLARKNVGRFHSLNQRLQAQGAAGPSRGGAARLQSNQPMTATGFGRSGGGAGQQARWAAGAGGGRQHGQQHGQRGVGGRPGGGGPGFGGGGGADEAVAESLRLVAEFPRPQRLYVLFLEAADSHRLNAHLIRCMSGKLRTLTAGEHTSGGLSERVAAVSTLAMFLGYLTFTRAGYAGSGSAGAGSSEADSAAPAAAGLVDVAATVEAAAAASEGGPLAWALPWVVRYLWFLPWDAEAVRAPYFRCLLARLAALHGSAELQPQQAHFSLAAFCLRSVLDDFAERVGPDIMPTAPGSSGSSSSSAGGATCPALSSLAAVDGLLDSRFLHLCCPTLEHSRQLFAASGGGGGGLQQQQQARRVKKIRPTAPSGAAAARTALQGGVAAALQQDASRDLLRLQLQRAFLEQYSTDEHKVKLRDVVDYVSDILAYNAASSAASAQLLPAGDAIAAQLKEAAAAVAAESQQQHQQARETGGEEAAAPSMLHPSVRLYLEALAEQLIAAHTTNVLQAAQADAEERIRATAVQAMAALTAPELGAAVIGTAASVVAEAAASAVQQRLRSQVPSAVRRTATEQLQYLLAAAARESKTPRQSAPPAP